MVEKNNSKRAKTEDDELIIMSDDSGVFDWSQLSDEEKELFSMLENGNDTGKIMNVPDNSK